MKRLIVLAVVSIMFYVAWLTPVNAEDFQTCVQVTQYGGAVGIVCGAHTPVEAGLADINPVVLASIFFALGGIGIYNYKKVLRAEVAL